MRYNNTVCREPTAAPFGYFRMAFLATLFGVQNHITLAQECARAVLIFAYGLLLLRLGGQRIFGHWSALDVIVSIIVGSALARAMTGSAPLPGTMAAAALLCLLHWLLAQGVARSPRFSRLVEGKAVALVEQGQINWAACKAHMISQADLAEALRQDGLAIEALEDVNRVTLEPSGHITLIKCEARKPAAPDRSAIATADHYIPRHERSLFRNRAPAAFHPQRRRVAPGPEPAQGPQRPVVRPDDGAAGGAGRGAN